MIDHDIVPFEGQLIKEGQLLSSLDGTFLNDAMLGTF